MWLNSSETVTQILNLKSSKENHRAVNCVLFTSPAIRTATCFFPPSWFLKTRLGPVDYLGPPVISSTWKSKFKYPGKITVNMKRFFEPVSAARKSSAGDRSYEQTKRKRSFQDHWKQIWSWLCTYQFVTSTFPPPPPPGHTPGHMNFFSPVGWANAPPRAGHLLGKILSKQ